MLIVINRLKRGQTRHGDSMYSISGGGIYACVFEGSGAYAVCDKLFADSVLVGNDWYRPRRLVLAEVRYTVRYTRDSAKRIWYVVERIIAIESVEVLWQWSADSADGRTAGRSPQVAVRPSAGRSPPGRAE